MSEAFYTAAAHAFEDVEVSTPAEAGPSSMGDAAATLDAAFDIEGTARLILDGGYKTVSTWSGMRLWEAGGLQLSTCGLALYSHPMGVGRAPRRSIHEQR